MTSSASAGGRSGSTPASRRASIVLPGARRAHQQEVMAARRRDLEGEPGGGLAPHVGQVGLGRRGVDLGRRRWLGPGRQARERGGQVAEAPDRPHPVAADEARLDRGRLGHHHLRRGERVDERDRARAPGGSSRRGPARPGRPGRPGTPPAAARSPRGGRRRSPGRGPRPALRSPEGARLTVTRWVGQRRWLESSAARTRSRASRHVVSGRPTIVKPGSPAEAWTSTRTWWPSTPRSVADGTVTCTAQGPPAWRGGCQGGARTAHPKRSPRRRGRAGR